jgi:hypothetical protein
MGVGQTTAPSTTLIMTSVRRSKAGVGSAVNDTSRELGGALGVAVMGSVLNSYYRGHVLQRLPSGVPAAAQDAVHASVAGALTVAHTLPPSLADQVVAVAQDTFSKAFGVATLVGAGMLFITSILVWTFQDRATPHAAAPASSHAREDLVDVELDALPALVDGHAAAERVQVEGG